MTASRSLQYGLVLLALCIVISIDGQLGVPMVCSGPDETWLKCGPSCQTRCDTLGKPCLIRHIRCPDGCYCNDGFARDASDKCIPTTQCGSN